MQNSLAKRLTYRIMIVVLVMLAFITSIVYFSVRNYMLDEAQGRYEGILRRMQEETRRRLSDIYVAAKNNVHDIERDIDHPDMLYDHMERIVKMNPGLKSSAILFLPDYYPEKKGTFMPMVRRDSTGRMYIAKIDSVYGYFRAPWYQDCLKSDTGIWVGAHFDPAHVTDVNRRTMLTTYATPVHNHQGQSVGLLCLQLSLQSMHRDFIREIQKMNEKYEKGHKRKSYCFIIDRHGRYIVHPDESLMLNESFVEQTKETPDTLDDRVVAEMVKREKGEAMMNVDGVDSWIYYRTIKYVDWTMVIVVPEKVIFHNGKILNTIILLTMLIGLVVLYFISSHLIRKTTKPLHLFAMSADQVALGNFSSPLPEIKTGDEVRLLHDAFENMQTSLSIYVEQLRKTITMKAALEQELKIAQGIQMAMLPKNALSTSGRKDFDLYASLTPARDVGGDLYDYFLRDNRLFFCIGDVTGKGVPAALMMAVMRAMFRSEARRADSAAAIVEATNKNLCEESASDYFVTMFVGILDLQTGHLDYCNAGHEAPFVAGEPLPIKHNLPVGALSDWTYEGQEAQLKDGDMLFLYTDGLTEAKNTEKQSMGRKHVVQLVQAHNNDTAQQLVEQMEAEAHRYAGEAEQSDDITLLAIKWHSSPLSPLTSHLSLKASMEDIGCLLPFITNAVQQAGIDEKEAKRLRLAVEESVANIINYGEATSITLQAKVEDGQLVLTIDDDGQPFDPTEGSTTDLSVPPDQRPPGGLGIIMLHQMTDGLAYQRADGHNILTLRKKVKR
ncbi:MAG: SpoIIE family protein phosphatase [Prevotella sp.]|nr:SpoIIE family protein phosphatase [Prevotella sp.]